MPKHDSQLPVGNVVWTATNSAGYAAPAALAVDVVLLTVIERKLKLLTVEATTGGRALPGGLIGPTENAAEKAVRCLHDKTGLEDIYLEQLATFTDPDRDARGWIPSVAHLALVPASTQPADRDARWDSATRPPKLAYDHREILRLALKRVRGKLWWSNIAVGILPKPFTLAGARDVYEAIAGTTYDASTFSRDLRSTGLIAPTGQRLQSTRGRPAALYEFAAQRPTWGAGRRKRVPGKQTAEPAPSIDGRT